VRIRSFLPSAREMLYALGLGAMVAGITYECDHPPEARAKPVAGSAEFRFSETLRLFDDCQFAGRGVRNRRTPGYQL